MEVRSFSMGRTSLASWAHRHILSALMPKHTQRVRAALRRAILIVAGISVAGPVSGQHKLGRESSFEAPRIQAASDEGQRELAKVKYPAGWKAELWASEPDVAHGVALDVADDGRVFVAESFRAWRGVPDIRGIMSWLDEDLASKSVDDRLAMMWRHLGEEGMEAYYKNTERVRLLEDPSGIGRATRSVVFAENFATPLDGVAAGVLARGKDVWFANIPNVWHLRDEDGDGVADFRQSISYGHGIRVGFLGHDLHGLTFGPDGRLYFSIGDRASVLQTEGRTVGTADSGAVFRCRPDGSDMEMFYSGLRNPQDLVFDEWGNLFTGDNNSDGGDQARWTYLIEGGDSGWRIGWQFIERPNPRGPWNSERMWAPQNDAQPAWLTPPIKNISAGPSGVSYYPGTGAGSDWQGTFTLCDFRGSAAGSGLWKFKHKPKGASFEIVEDEQFIWALNATDGHWGPDGAFWLLDWTHGWEPDGKGRIYRFHDPAHIDSSIVTETKRILKEGFQHRGSNQVVSHLDHPNYRVRQAAQFELAARGESEIPLLMGRVQAGPTHRRLHAIWALGQIADNLHATRQGARSAALEPLMAYATDRQFEVRSNIARVLGDARYEPAYDVLRMMTSDANSHTRALATIALGKLGRVEAVPAILQVLRANADADPHIRHAAVTALAACAEPEALLSNAKDTDAAVRMGVLLAFRRWQRNEISVFLNDSDPRIITEAARAIHDLPISGAMRDLAMLIDRVPSDNDALARRILNANYRFGTRETAESLARFAANASGPESMRVDALEALNEWPKNSGRDRITSLWRPTAFARDARIPAAALNPNIEVLLADSSNRVRAAAARAVGGLLVRDAAGSLQRIVVEREGDGMVRVAALNALSLLEAAELDAALDAADSDPDEDVRKASTSIRAGELAAEVGSRRGGRRGARTDAGETVRRLMDVVVKGSLAEKQNAIGTLAKVPGAAADAALKGLMEEVLKSEMPKELVLDVLDAVSGREPLKEMLAVYEEGLDTADPLARFRPVLYGGNPAEGQKIFIERADVSCVRCHMVGGEGGVVGPAMDKLASRVDREYLLRSIIMPNSEIAEGFENILISMENDDLYAGVIHSETDTHLTLNSPEDGFITLKKSDIVEREKGMSGMPEGFGEILNRQDLRHLIEYLASLK